MIEKIMIFIKYRPIGLGLISMLLVDFYVNCLSNLKQFETFSEISVTTRIKRSNGVQVLLKDLWFKVFDRDFHLSLKSGTTVLTYDFRAYLVDGDGRKVAYWLDHSQLFTGIIKDKPNTFVNAFVVDNVWSINILDDNDTFAVEPAGLFLNASENPENHLLFAYRVSDFKNQEAGKCGLNVTGNSSRYNTSQAKIWAEDNRTTVNSGKHRRLVKQAKEKVCVVSIVGEYEFYKKRCRSNHVTCFLMLISIIQFTDAIYSSSTFLDSNNQVIKLGVQVGLFFLYTSATKDQDGNIYPHYNQPGVAWTSTSKLDSVAYYLSFQPNTFCHSHVFTSYPMPEHVLGLTFMASLCLEPKPGTSLLSSGFSSSEDITTGQIHSLMFHLIFAHAHSLGSYHDPDSTECAPEDTKGGKYLMWGKSVSGIHTNHKIFSPCSLKTIGRTLQAKGSCLADRSSVTSLCGNGIVEAGEECDSGADGMSSPCCTSNCFLTPGAVCNDFNEECCIKCQVATNTTPCFNSALAECKKNSYCTGTSLVCPALNNLPDGTICMDGGACVDGLCRNLCQLKSITFNISLTACMCTGEHACKQCCFDHSDPENPGLCVNHTEIIMSDGYPCYLGICEHGECRSYQAQVRSINSQAISPEYTQIFYLMRSNIVTIVIVLALTIGVPCTLILANLTCWLYIGLIMVLVLNLVVRKFACKGFHYMNSSKEEEHPWSLVWDIQDRKQRRKHDFYSSFNVHSRNIEQSKESADKLSIENESRVTSLNAVKISSSNSMDTPAQFPILLHRRNSRERKFATFPHKLHFAKDISQISVDISD